MTTTWHRRLFIRLARRPRLTLALGCTLLTFVLLACCWSGHLVSSGLIAYNLGALLYLVLAARMMLDFDEQTIRSRARMLNDGQFAILFGVVAASALALLAIAAQLSLAKDFSGFSRSAHLALAGLTVFTSWSFTQVMFALHYAHDFYHVPDDCEPGGLEFPGTTVPNYVDFLYVACSIGTSGQTADVAFTSSALRRVGLLHCVLAFFYNATLIALTINMAAGLI
jgi:uncharacterized membrane protein